MLANVNIMSEINVAGFGNKRGSCQDNSINSIIDYPGMKEN